MPITLGKPKPALKQTTLNKGGLRMERPQIKKGKNSKKTLDEAEREVKRRIEEMAAVSEVELAEKAGLNRKAKDGKAGRPNTTAEEMQAKIALAYRLHIRGLSGPEIAHRMNCSEAMAYHYLAKMEESLRIDPKQLDLPRFVGDSMMFFTEVRAVALGVSMSKASTKDKLRGLSVALQAERDKNDYLKMIGMYTEGVSDVFERLVMARIGHLGGTDDSQKSTPTELFMEAVASGLSKGRRLMIENREIKDIEQ